MNAAVNLIERFQQVGDKYGRHDMNLLQGVE
jgi:hypothetical protein